MSSTIASPTPTSAAAIVITNSANTCPDTLWWNAENATRLMFTAFSISSMLISTSTPLRRASTPYTPVQNRNALRIRNWFSCTGSSISARDRDGTDECGQQEHRHDLERHHVGPEDRVGDGGRQTIHPQRVVDADLSGAERVDEQEDQHAEDEQGRHRGRPALVVVEIRLSAHRRAREHDPEQEEDHDRTDVHEHLDPRDELRGEQDVLGRGAREHDDEVERGVHDVARPHDTERRARHRDRDDREGDVLRYHTRLPSRPGCTALTCRPRDAASRSSRGPSPSPSRHRVPRRPPRAAPARARSASSRPDGPGRGAGWRCSARSTRTRGSKSAS